MKGNVLGNGESEATAAAHKVGVSTLRDRSIFPFTLVGSNHALRTVLLALALAHVALAARSCLCSDTDALAKLEVFHVGAEACNDADDLMTNDTVIACRAGPPIGDCVNV